MSSIWLLGKKKESKLCFVGFVNCVDLVSFRSYGIYGFLKLFFFCFCFFCFFVLFFFFFFFNFLSKGKYIKLIERKRARTKPVTARSQRISLN